MSQFPSNIAATEDATVETIKNPTVAPAGLIKSVVKAYPLNFFATKQALWPPKPKELFAIASTLISRAWFGT